MQVFGIAGQRQSWLLKAGGGHPVLQATGTGDQFQVQSVLSVVQQVLYGELMVSMLARVAKRPFPTALPCFLTPVGFDQAEVAIFTTVQHVDLARTGIGKYQEILVQQVHLHHRFFNGHRFGGFGFGGNHNRLRI